MIYHKKPDGSIEQIETTEENKTDMLRAYNLDKELAEQRGQEFGTIYNDTKSLPDEDMVALGLITQDELTRKNIDIKNRQKIDEARKYLLDTNYKIINEFETGIVCPEEIKKERERCREIIRNTTCEELNGG